MFKKIYYTMGAAITLGLMAPFEANAQMGAQPNTGNNFSIIARNIIESLQDLPLLISALSYLMGVLLGVLGVMKIKDHVENPTQTPLKDGAIRLVAGGALFALPAVFESMLETIGSDGAGVEVPKINRATFQAFA